MSSPTTESDKVIRVGSRKSQLALIQTKYVISRLQRLYPDTKFEIRTMTTMGDRVLGVSLPKIGEKSLFTKDLEDALTNGGVDFVVHSLKDLPTALPIGMAIGAVLERESPQDALVLNKKYEGKTLKTLPAGCTIGTSSLRRTAQLKRNFAHLEVCDIRGNLNTRLAKLDAEDSKFAGIILAEAGLVRMGWETRISQQLGPEEILYAVGQGALAVECRSNDEFILDMLSLLCHTETQYRILVERSFLKTLGGGCSAPVAVHTVFNEKTSEIEVEGAVWSLDGKVMKAGTLKHKLETPAGDDDDEVTQAKRQRLSRETPERESQASTTKKESPKIIDDSASTSNAATTLNITKLMDIHGEMFKKCPFSKTNANNNTATPTKEPNFPIGQDFMGSCPMFETTEQKVDALKYDMKCPITGQSAETSAEKCPYIAEQHRTQAESVAGLEENGVKLVDYNNDDKPDATSVPDLIDNSHTLYCGMYRPKCVTKKIFDDCEALGKQLAQNLINEGALEIMQAAQKEIREKA